MRSAASGSSRFGLRIATRWDRPVARIVAAVLVPLSVALAPFGLSSTGALAHGTMPNPFDQTLPSGQQLIRRMEQAVLSKGTFHESMQSTTLLGGIRETLQQTLDVDLRHHLLRQVGVDRKVRLPSTLVSRDTFARVSVGYDAATRDNSGAWSCQHFQPGQVRLIGRGTYLAGIGWPRRAFNLGPTVWKGVPVWRVQATVFGGGSAGGYTPSQRGSLFIARSDGTLLREVWRPGKGSTASATYSRYGAPVRIVLPSACRTQVSSLAPPQTVTVQLQPVGCGKVHGRATLTAVDGATRAYLDVRGLRPRSRAAALVHYGVCSDPTHLSASSASLPNLRPNARGRARARGRVLTALHRQVVRLSVLADGHHALVIVLPHRGLVACGTVP